MHADSRVEQLATEARGIVGSAAVWRGSEKDAVDGIVPKLIVEPSDTQTLAEILVWASERQQKNHLGTSSFKIRFSALNTTS